MLRAGSFLADVADRCGPQPNVVVFRALHLGDLLCSIPALRALRRALPQARISLIGLPWAASFVERFPQYLDGFIAFPGYPGFVERPAPRHDLQTWIQAMRRQRIDLAIQLHGTGYEVNELLLALGSRYTAGFHPPEQAPPGEGFRPWPAQGHEIRRQLQLMRALGAASREEQLCFPRSSEDQARARALQAMHQLEPGAYVCLHVGARLPSRRWPLRRFAGVADALVGQYGVRLVLTGGATEQALTDALMDLLQPATRAQTTNLAGATSLGALAVLVADARLLISNDTGLSHVAAAVRAPSVIVASGSDVARWAPLDAASHRVLWHATPCRPCSHEECPIGHPCALGVQVDDVIRGARELLESGVAA